jgi:hypothetical protein
VDVLGHGLPVRGLAHLAQPPTTLDQSGSLRVPCSRAPDAALAPSFLSTLTAELSLVVETRTSRDSRISSRVASVERFNPQERQAESPIRDRGTYGTMIA